MTSDEILSLFRDSGALLEGHFRLSSGLHSPGYLQCALVLQHPARAEAIGAAMAAEVRPLNPTTVLSPAMGGVIIGHEVARSLGTRAIFAERADGALTLRRGFRIEPGDRVLVVEDVITTGKSTRETIEVARQMGAEVVAAAAIVDRSSDVEFGLPAHALIKLSLVTYPPAACPLCEAGTPILKPGSRPDVGG